MKTYYWKAIHLIVSLSLFTFSCGSEEKLITHEETLTQSSISLIPSATPSNDVKIPINIEVIGSPTTDNSTDNILYPGFSMITKLPNDIFLPGNITNDSNMIESLAVFGRGGGGGICEMNPETFVSVGKGSVDICNIPGNEEIIIELVRPDGSVAVDRKLLYSDSGDSDLYYCFDNILMLQNGKYYVNVTSSSLSTKTGSFLITSTDEQRIFVSKSSNSFSGCNEGIIVEGQKTQIFYSGFESNEKILVALYHYKNGNYVILNTWDATLDSSGSLVQEIEDPQIQSYGDYGLAVFGDNTYKVSFSGTESFQASAALTLNVVSEAKPALQIVQSTITPQPIKPSSTPQPIKPSSTPKFTCSNAPQSRVNVGDSIRVTFTNGVPLRLRSSPKVNNGNIDDLLAEGTQMQVLDGPRCAPRPGRNDSYVFWKVRVSSSGAQGWVAEGDKNMYYIEVYP